MKIGILTFHRSYNYGAFMQCYSLVSRLKKDFPEITIEVIDYTAKKIVDMYQKELLKIGDEKIKKQYEKRQCLFSEAQKYLPLSDVKIVSDETDEIIEYMNSTYDAVVVGSDAVWNWRVRGFPNLYFLKEYKGLKFSYAASAHGLNYQNMTQEQKKYLKEAFSDFKYIGVRDVTTEKMVGFCESKILPAHNCDPTAFLDLNNVPCDMEYLKKKLISRGVDFSKPIIGIMAGENIGREIKRHYGKKVQLVALFEGNKYADVHLYDLTPFEWAHIFSFFKVTVTHFFHGTMLSLVNGVPVIPVEFTNNFSAKNVTKIEDVMQRLSLSSWHFTADYRNRSFVKKVLYKIGLCYDKSLWKKVYEKIDDFLVNNYTDVINEKIKNEASAYNSFYDELKKYLR